MHANEATEPTGERNGSTSLASRTTIKKLRFSDPDLSIVVGDGEEQKTYECYSQIMAMQSGYIDTALAISMREHETRILRFPEINPDAWDKMMCYLQQGAADPDCVEDIRVVLPWYDKYNFDAGWEVCDRMLARMISRPNLLGSNLDESMAAMELVYLYAHRMTVSTMEKAKKLLFELLHAGLEGSQSLERSHISQLVPALRADDDAWSYTTKHIIRRFPVDGDRDKYLDSVAFPDLLLSSFDAHENQRKSASKLAQTLLEAKSMEAELLSLMPQLRVKVSAAGAGITDLVTVSGLVGRYHFCSTYWQHGQGNLRIEFDPAVSCWILKKLYGLDWSTLYVCFERSIHELLPPKTGWRPAIETDPPLGVKVLVNYISKMKSRS